MKFLAAVLATVSAAIVKGTGPGTQCKPFTYTSDSDPVTIAFDVIEAEWAAHAKTLTDAATVNVI